jgi:hypothetical protein
MANAYAPIEIFDIRWPYPSRPQAVGVRKCAPPGRSFILRYSSGFMFLTAARFGEALGSAGFGPRLNFIWYIIKTPQVARVNLKQKVRAEHGGGSRAEHGGGSTIRWAQDRPEGVGEQQGAGRGMKGARAEQLVKQQAQ